MSHAEAAAEAIRTHLVGSPVAIRVLGLWTGGKDLDRADRLDEATVVGDAILLDFADAVHLILRAPGGVSFEREARGTLSMLRVARVESVTWTRYSVGRARSAATLHQTDFVVLGEDLEVTQRSLGKAVTSRQHRTSDGVDFFV